MTLQVLQTLLLPFLGTVLGSACVFILKHAMSDRLSRALSGFAAGVMVAASVWSLLIPSLEQASQMGAWSFLPAAAGFWLGILFLLLLDRLIPHLHRNAEQAEGPKSRLQRATMLVLAVTLHNIPEGMAVGVVCAGYLAGGSGITPMAAFALALGIAFFYGVLSGIVEPLGALLTILAAGFLLPSMPYLLSFAAGAMIYVVVEELIPEMSAGEHSNIGTVFFAVGFTVMMILAVALG